MKAEKLLANKIFQCYSKRRLALLKIIEKERKSKGYSFFDTGKSYLKELG